MNITKLPETLTKPEVEALRKAFGELYDQNKTSFKDPVTGMHFGKVEDFVDYLYSPEIGIPRGTSIKHIGITLENWYEILQAGGTETTMSGAPEYAAPSNTLTPDQLKQFQKEDSIQKEKIKQTQIDSKQAVQTAIKRQQEIYTEQIQKTKAAEAVFKKQKVYYEVEQKAVEEAQEVKNLRQQAEADPEKFIKDATNQFKNNPNLKNLSQEEAQIASEQAAVTLHDILTENPNSPAFQAVIVNNIVSNPELLKKIAPNPKDQEVLTDIESFLTNSKTAQFELAGQFFDLSKIKGSSFDIKFFDSQGENRKELDWSQITSQHTNSLNQQSFLLDNLKGFGEGEIRSRILLGVGSRLEGYILKLPANSLLAKTYNSEFVQFGLSSLGIVEASPWVAIEGSWIGRIAIGSGFGNAAGFIQAKTGINLGVKMAAKAIGSKIAGTVATEAATAAVGAAAGAEGAVAAGAAAGAALGGGVLSWLTAVIGAAVGWVASKIPWKKVKEWSAAIVGGLAGLIALPFIGLGAAIGVGVGTTALSFGFGGGLGGATLGGIGAGIGGFFGALAGATLGAIGGPILAILIGFPVVVALILFIINSGAYVVPPGGFGGSSGISISGTPINLNCDSLDKSLDPGAYAAELIACALDKSKLNPLFARMVGNASWQQLGNVLNGTAIDALAQSANVIGSWGGTVSKHLQCVGLVAATAGQAYGTSFSQTDACLYIGQSVSGYNYVSGTKGMKGGDFFVIDGKGGCDKAPNFSPGHIGVVISVAGVGVSCIDANEIGPGQVRVADGCFTLSEITGYLRKK